MFVRVFLLLLFNLVPDVPAGGDDPTKDEKRPRLPMWTDNTCKSQLDVYRDEIAGLRTQLAAQNQQILDLGGKVEDIPEFQDEDADHGSTLFLTMCAGATYFDIYCGPLFASFERAYESAAMKHRVVAFTLHVPRNVTSIASKRFGPWGKFEVLTDWVPDTGIDGGTEQHYGGKVELDTGSIVCGKNAAGHSGCQVPEFSQENRDKKTQLDSLWFPDAVARYLSEHGPAFSYAVLMDSDILFAGPLGGFLPAYRDAVGAAMPPDWDVGFTVYDQHFHVPWHDDPAEAGRTINGYSRINCGVVLLNLEKLDIVLRFLRKWTQVSTILTEMHEAVKSGDQGISDGLYQAAGKNLSIWLQWQSELVQEFRGNDQAGLALLVSGYRTEHLKVLLGWADDCHLCQEPVTADLKCFEGESHLPVRFRALPARVLNHPESMVNGEFPDDLLIVHLKGLWWRVALSKGVLTSTATREPYWNRDTITLYDLCLEIWQTALPKEFRLNSEVELLDLKGRDITDMFFPDLKKTKRRKKFR